MYKARLLTDAELLSEDTFQEDLMEHFLAFAELQTHADLNDISSETKRVIALVTGDEVETDSVLDLVITGSVAAAETATFRKVASVLGYDAEAFEMAINEALGDDIKIATSELMFHVKKAKLFCDNLGD